MGWSISSIWLRARTMGKSVDYHLDGLVSVSVPSRFKLLKEFQIANFYYLQPFHGQFTYFFSADEFTNLGGNTQRPLILSLTVYDPSQRFEGLDDHLSSIYWNGITKVRCYDTRVILERDTSKLIQTSFSTPLGPSSNNEKIVILSDEPKRYRLVLIYWDAYLSADGATRLIQRVGASIRVEAELNKVAQMAIDDFYKRHPDKRP